MTACIRSLVYMAQDLRNPFWPSQLTLAVRDRDYAKVVDRSGTKAERELVEREAEEEVWSPGENPHRSTVVVSADLPPHMAGLFIDRKMFLPEECTCFVTPERTWTRYGSAVEPGSQMEPNPECPVHFPNFAGAAASLADGTSDSASADGVFCKLSVREEKQPSAAPHPDPAAPGAAASSPAPDGDDSSAEDAPPSQASSAELPKLIAEVLGQHFPFRDADLFGCIDHLGSVHAEFNPNFGTEQWHEHVAVVIAARIKKAMP